MNAVLMMEVIILSVFMSGIRANRITITAIGE